MSIKKPKKITPKKPTTIKKNTKKVSDNNPIIESKQVVKKKRVLYPWLKYKTSRAAKVTLAVLADKHIKKYTSLSKLYKDKLESEMLTRFPDLYGRIKKHYNKHGRTLSEKEYNKLLFMRLKCMYDKDLTPSSEHPSLSKDISFKKTYTRILKQK